MSAAADSGEVRPLIDSDLAFHLALARASGNPLLIEMLRRLLEPLFGFVMLRMIETREATSAWAPDLPRHREILYLIHDGNPALAAAFMEHSVGCSPHPPALCGLRCGPAWREEDLICRTAA